MKNKGISLIVLVVTIVVIIILAGAVILSLTKNNPINEANQASFKYELKSLDEQVLLSVSKEFLIDSNIINKKITDTDILYRLIPSLKNSKYDGRVYISNGKLTINASKFTRQEIQWAIEAQIQIGDLPIIKDVNLTSTETTITVDVEMEDTSSIIGYMYKLTGIGSNNEWIENASNMYTFEKLKIGTEYIVEVKAKTNELESISYLKSITTLGVSDLVSLVPNKIEWTNGNIAVTLSHAKIPSNYELQYSIGNNEWVKYTSPIVVEYNTSFKGRLYNIILDNEIGANKIDITNIDKIEPTNASISISNNNIEQNQSTNVTITQNDILSGIDITKCKWIVNTSAINIGTIESLYTDGTFTSISQILTVNKNVVGTYYVHVLSVDKAGNKIETVSKAITVRTTGVPIVGKVKAGDYISYIPTISSYISPSSLNGDSNQTFNPSNYRDGWRVLTNSGGIVSIVSVGSVGNLTLTGKTGYINTVSVLNNICSQYVNPTYATNGRSLGTTNQSIGSIDSSLVVWNADSSNVQLNDKYYLDDLNAINSIGIKFNYAIRLGSRIFDGNFGTYFIQENGNVGTGNLYIKGGDGSIVEVGAIWRSCTCSYFKI